MPAVVCFGEALWDLLPGGRLVGGAPLNVAVRLAGLRIDTVLLSRVGNDALGRELLESLSTTTLDTRHVQIDPRAPTGIVRVDASIPAAVKYEIATPAAWDYIDAEPFIRASDTRPRAIVFGSLAARNEVSRTGLLRLLELSSLRIFDVNLRPPHDSRAIVEMLLKRTDWLKLNADELGIVAGWIGADGSPNESIISICRHYAIDAACVTLGAEGALMYRDGETFSQAGFSVPVVDTIGCGDAFLAGWIAKLLDRASPQTALTHACAAGALAATAAGANAPLSVELIDTLVGGRSAP